VENGARSRSSDGEKKVTLLLPRRLSPKAKWHLVRFCAVLLAAAVGLTLNISTRRPPAAPATTSTQIHNDRGLLPGR
jgi:hypothetical protein